MKNDAIKNIIFDMGDVIINIDVPRTARAFAELSQQQEDELIELFQEKELFRQFETGHLDDAGFRSYVRELLRQEHWDEATIDKAWNALLLDLPPERVELIQRLGQSYRLFLLSNTSSIHVAEVNRILQQVAGVPSLTELFETVFLSYEMGLMKPDLAIYQRVLEQAGLVAEETLFLDDNLDNIRAAASLGIQTIHVQKPFTILDYLQDYVA
ncbi:HAD family phosphatase [Rhabdobacter roseus]|uniref:Putative hydrolase of the HAD superfamily n=1 Tax=Rhabdobacter roseus TaxID=1655419 RepID=A0A840U540_9BACT|nr:HAD family phosphatase [Rhabdobacter roseus]MBB5287438.1 putative hydrolase of the HAD superfamily [Rhabdobacter roseus]